MKQVKHIRQAQRAATIAGVALMAIQACAPASAGPREQARRIHDRLAGVPPSDAVLTQMAPTSPAGRPMRPRSWPWATRTSIT